MKRNIARLKRVLYFLLACSLVYVVTEGAAWTAIKLAFPASSLRSLDAERASLATDSGAVGRAPEALLQEPAADRRFIHLMHPYYGYVMHPAYGFPSFPAAYEPINDLGFVSDAPAVMHRSPDRVVIAIAGGSVARFGSSLGKAALLRQLQSTPRFAGREIVVTTYAMGAYKQPQHLMVINDVLTRGGEIDVLILIDGFNEAVLGININRPHRIDPFFPHYWFTLARDMPPIANVRTIGRIEYLRALRARRARLFSGIGARSSMFVSFVWKALDSRLALAIGSAREELIASPTDSPSTAEELPSRDRASFGTFPDYLNVRDFYQDAAASWATASFLLDRLVAAQGGVVFHFLQPNQYFPGGKPLTGEERQLMLPERHPQHWNLATGYPYFRAAGERLRQAGVSFHDLTYLFEDHPETLYNDSCCHLNQRGNDLLMEAVGRVIGESIGAAGPAEAAADLPRFREEDVFSPENLTRFAPRDRPYDDGSERPW